MNRTSFDIPLVAVMVDPATVPVVLSNSRRSFSDMLISSFRRLKASLAGEIPNAISTALLFASSASYMTGFFFLFFESFLLLWAFFFLGRSNSFISSYNSPRTYETHKRRHEQKSCRHVTRRTQKAIRGRVAPVLRTFPRRKPSSSLSLASSPSLCSFSASTALNPI